ncbi:hypothetical protein [Streptomyces blastmyceticus]|uniref:Transcriptional regulator n=1 Tax=Streptomyces blastmyceticus TaxID=68180 RepID=A0ABP3G7I7_9ACTN
MYDTSALTSCLQRLSWSPERLAREINRICGTGTISSKAPYNWLKGSRPRGRLPHVVAKILSGRLGETVTVDALWSVKPAARSTGGLHLPPQRGTPERQSGREAVDAAVDWLVDTDRPPVARTGGEEVGPAMLAALVARICQLRRLDDTCGGKLVLDWTLQDLRWARKLAAEASYDEPTGVRLHTAVAELGQLAGWIAADLGMEAQSRTHLLGALHAARTAGDRLLGAYIISCLSYHAAWDRRGEEALRLIRIARKGVENEPVGLGQALLATRQARAHASLGDRKSCERVLDEAAGLSDGREAGVGAPWGYWLVPAVMVADAGRAWLETGRPDRAEENLAHGLELLGETQPLNRLLHHTSLAEARLARRDVDGAAAAADAALDLAEHTTSVRANVRLAGLRRRFEEHNATAVRHVVQRTEHLLARRPATTAG